MTTEDTEEAGRNRRSLMKATGLLGLGAIAAAASVGRAAAQDASPQGSLLYDILKRGKLIVGTGSTNPPWHFEDENGELAGMDTDMGRILAKALFDDPTKIEFVRQGDDARIPNLLTRKVDITIQFMTVTGARARQVGFSIPYFRSSAALAVSKDGKYKTYDELKAAGSAATIAVLKNAYAEDLVHAALPEATVLQLDSQANALQAIQSGRADASVPGLPALRWLQLQFPGEFIDPGYHWFPQTYGAAVAPGDQVWLNFVNIAFHEAMTGVEFDSYRTAFKRWLGQDLKNVPVGAPFEYVPG